MQVCHRGRNKQTDCDRKWRVGDTDRQRVRGKNNKVKDSAAVNELTPLKNSPQVDC